MSRDGKESIDCKTSRYLATLCQKVQQSHDVLINERGDLASKILKIISKEKEKANK
jgi:hypothetical protein